MYRVALPMVGAALIAGGLLVSGGAQPELVDALLGPGEPAAATPEFDPDAQFLRLSTRQRALAQRIATVRKNADSLADELEKRLGEAFQQVSERLEAVHKGLGEMQTLASGVGDLNHLDLVWQLFKLQGLFQILKGLLPRWAPFEIQQLHESSLRHESSTQDYQRPRLATSRRRLPHPRSSLRVCR